MLFEDGEDSVVIFYLQRREVENESWTTVLELHLERGRAWGDEIDQLYRARNQHEWIIHISGYGYWGDAEFYRSLDDGLTWEPHPIKFDLMPPFYYKDHFEEGEDGLQA